MDISFKLKSGKTFQGSILNPSIVYIYCIYSYSLDKLNSLPSKGLEILRIHHQSFLSYGIYDKWNKKGIDISIKEFLILVSSSQTDTCK